MSFLHHTSSASLKRRLQRRPFLALALAFLFLFPVAASLEASQKADKVLVQKSARKMHLLRDGKIFKTYRISLGANPVGHKQQQGDSRTPEGTYVLDYRNRHSKFYKSIHLSYPNAEDRANARRRGVNPGGAIFIHGSPNDVTNGIAQSFMKSTDWTDGCIAVNNSEMDEIWRLVRDGTPITIEP